MFSVPLTKKNGPHGMILLVAGVYGGSSRIQVLSSKPGLRTSCIFTDGHWLAGDKPGTSQV
jgi:hypothetical protein